MITHSRTSNPVIKDKFKKMFKADTWQAHGESGRHLLSVIYLSKVRLISGFILVSCITMMQINKVKCFKKVNGRLRILQRWLKNGGSGIVYYL